MTPAEETKLLKIARGKYSAAKTSSEKQRQREDDDIDFFNGNQWSAEAQAMRAGADATGNMPPVPSRPCMVINKQIEPVTQVINGMINADLGFQLVPADDFGSIA